MRKVMLFVLICNLVFFSACVYFEYAGANYDLIHSDKSPIQIARPVELDSYEFVELLNDISKENRIDIYYEKIENASSGRPHYLIYKTNATDSFMPIKVEGKGNAVIGTDEFLTTAKDSAFNGYHIIGSSMLYSIDIFPIQNLDFSGLEQGVFYTRTDEVRLWTELLYDRGISTAIVRSNPYQSVVPEWKRNQIVLFIMFIISLLFHFFSQKRETVIKKLSGYSSVTIVFEEMKTITFATLGIMGSAFVVIGSNLFAYNKSAVWDYAKFILPYYCIALLSVEVSIFITGLYVFTQSHAVDITGKTKNIEISFVALMVKIIVLFFCVFQTTAFVVTVQQYHILSRTISNNKEILSNKYYLPFSAIGVDIDGNMDAYIEKSKQLLNALYNSVGENNILIIDSSEYDGIHSDNEYSSFVMINKTYFEKAEVYDEEGFKIESSTLNSNTEYLFVPMQCSKETMYAAEGFYDEIKNNGNAELVKYSEASLLSFRPECGDDTGHIYNGILYLPSREVIAEYAIGLMSGYNMMIISETGNPYDLISDHLKEEGMEDVIVECVNAFDYYKATLQDAQVSEIQAIYMIILMAVLLVVSSVFYSMVYFENNKKVIALKTMHGFGVSVYKNFFIQSIVIFSACCVFEKIVSGSVIYTLIGIMIDLLIFLVTMQGWTMKNISTILKGE